MNAGNTLEVGKTGFQREMFLMFTDCRMTIANSVQCGSDSSISVLGERHAHIRRLKRTETTTRCRRQAVV